jgi:hypothetical protein
LPNSARSALPKGRLFVIAREERYSLESIILDPILLVLLLARESKTRKYLLEIGLAPDLTYLSLLNSVASELQKIADAICKYLFGENCLTETIVCKYVGGFSLNLSKAYIQDQGHNLETEIVKKIPKLKMFREKLKQEIVARVMADKPELIPDAILQTFKELLSAGSHPE